MEKYLSRYAEPEIEVLADLPDQQPWARVVTIPACNESPGFLRAPPPGEGRSLLILVINEADGASERVRAANLALNEAVNQRFTHYWQSGPEHGLSLFSDPAAERDLLVIDRFSTGRTLPVKGGVGHARKIAADLACGLIQKGRVISEWIHCTDADVHLPERYFTCITAIERQHLVNTAALIYPFHHGDDHGEPTDKPIDEHSDSHNNDDHRDVVLATRLYELSLRYYVAGMEFAQSPYAFHTIGSTMAVHATRYASVRGFPKRQAGEDFYLLNKLAKVGAVKTIAQEAECEPIEIRSRRSDRVPFGTGAAVNQITALDQPVWDFRFYHPSVFVLLRRWLDCLPLLWHKRSSDYPAILSEHPPVYRNGTMPLESTLPNHALIDGLQTLGADAALAHAYRQSSDQNQFSRQMHTWFDAFRTLKLIHHLRAHQLASISYETLAADSIFQELIVRDPQLARFFRQLLETTQAMERTRAGSGL